MGVCSFDNNHRKDNIQRQALLTGKANTICQTADGYIWIGQYAGLTRYDAKSFDTITAYNDYNITGITALASYGNSLVIGTQSGLFIRYDNGEIKSLSENLTDKMAINDIKVYGDVAFIASDTGVFLYSLGGYIKKYNPLQNIRSYVFFLAIILSFATMAISYRNYTVSSINESLMNFIFNIFLITFKSNDFIDKIYQCQYQQQKNVLSKFIKQ